MMWQITFAYTEPISANEVQITVYAENYDEGLTKAVKLDAPGLFKKSLKLVEAIEIDEEITFVEDEETNQN